MKCGSILTCAVIKAVYLLALSIVLFGLGHSSGECAAVMGLIDRSNLAICIIVVTFYLCDVMDTNDSQPTETVAVHAILIGGGTTENVRRCAGIQTIAGLK